MVRGDKNFGGSWRKRRERVALDAKVLGDSGANLVAIDCCEFVEIKISVESGARC